jgi:phosphatidylglycerol lysyltransferase
MSAQSRLERRLIAIAAALIGVFNIVLAMFRAPLAGIGQFRHIVPGQAIMGSGYVLVVLGIVLLVTSRGLWHGKRFAWVVAVGCAAGSAFAHPLKNLDIWGTAGSLIFLGSLFGARPQFPARSDPPATRRGLALTLTALAIVFIYSWAGLYLLDNDFRHSVNVIDGLSDSLRLLFILPATAAEPVSRHGSWFLESARVSFLFVFVFGVFQLLQPVVYRAVTSPAERERVRDLLRRYADSSLAWFALEPDKSYFFSDSGNAVLAFKVVGNTAVVMGDPLGDEREFGALIDAFQIHCELDAWSYGFHQARPQHLALYEAHGLKALKIGEEGAIDLAEFTLSGQPMKHLRATMNRFEREGYTAEVLKPPHSADLITRLRALSDEWLAHGKRRERSFTVGFFDPEALQENEVLIARDAAGEVVGFANIIPSFNSRDGNFDMLRHGKEPKDVSDFLYVSLVRLFKDRGLERMTVGLAPLSGAGQSLSPADAAVRLLYKYGGFMFRFKGLREYKDKFASTWEPRYLIYPSEAELLGISLAVSRAGELKPGHWPAQRGGRKSRGGRGPLSRQRPRRAASGARV